MRVTFLGQAGLYVESRGASVLCDPWFNPAFYASWFPFPSNEGVDLGAIGRPDFLFISHEHQDHLDRRFLAERVWKRAAVVLPPSGLGGLERELRGLGFESFLRPSHGVPLAAGGFEFTALAASAPGDGPLGDCALLIDDGRTRVLNQNDAHLAGLDELARARPIHAHFLQFSGAIWYPAAYDFPEALKRALGRRKRENQQARALRFAEQADAAHVFPSSGPACFLDDELFELNDFDRDPANIFCDQAAFLDYMAARGDERGKLAVPGTVIELDGPECRVTHPLPDAEIARLFSHKREYLLEYRRRRLPEIAAAKAAWRRGDTDLLAELKGWLEPLLAQAPRTRAGVGASVLLDCSGERLVIDFIRGEVRRWNGERCAHRFALDAGLVEDCVRRREPDWVNSLFLSMRFKAERDGAFNEHVYTFFKSLSVERMRHVEAYDAGSEAGGLWRCGDHLIERRCPHQGADLERFGQASDGVLTCTMHGWRFELATGRCLNARARDLRAQPLDKPRETVL
jgi:UDP-MurNAc hydroxylase